MLLAQVLNWTLVETNQDQREKPLWWQSLQTLCKKTSCLCWFVGLLNNSNNSHKKLAEFTSCFCQKRLKLVGFNWLKMFWTWSSDLKILMMNRYARAAITWPLHPENSSFNLTTSFCRVFHSHVQGRLASQTFAYIHAVGWSKEQQSVWTT